jgi:hypothetical protein
VSAAEARRRQAVFGGADGLVLALGLIAGLTRSPGALFHAAVSAGLAELVGMTAGAWLSDRGAGILAALASGGGALAACVVPAVPYAVTTGAAALIPSLALTAAVAGVIARLRPERGLLAAAQTFGVLVTAAALCYAASLA